MENRPQEPPKKFLFDMNDFSEEALRKKLEAARRPTFSQEEMEASRKTGFEQGRAAGIKETVNSQESQIRDVLQQVVLAASRLEQAETARMAAFIEQSVLISAQMLSKICPAILEIMALTQIETFVREVLTQQVKSQSITVYVPEAFVTHITTRLEEMLQSMRRKTACTVVGDATLAATECRCEWTGGGAEWHPERTATSLLQMIVTNLPEHLRPAAILPPERMDETRETPHTESITTGD